MFTKTQQGSGKAYWGFLIGVVSLAFLSMNGFAAEKQGAKKAEQPPYGSFALAPPGYQGFFPYGHSYGSFPKGKYRGEYGSWGWEYYPERLRVSGILNRAVFDEGGQQVGEMDDLIIGRNGKVATLILSVGRGALLEFDEKLVTLPFKPLKVNGAGIVYEVTPQQLKGLPGFHYEKK